MGAADMPLTGAAERMRHTRCSRVHAGAPPRSLRFWKGVVDFHAGRMTIFGCQACDGRYKKERAWPGKREESWQWLRKGRVFGYPGKWLASGVKVVRCIAS